MNPVDWIKNMYRPGDYVVLKLDIDNDEVEGALVEQILDLEGAGDMIAELFFEKHYAAPDMKSHRGVPSGSEVDASAGNQGVPCALLAVKRADCKIYIQKKQCVFVG